MCELVRVESWEVKTKLPPLGPLLTWLFDELFDDLAATCCFSLLQFSFGFCARKSKQFTAIPSTCGAKSGRKVARQSAENFIWNMVWRSCSSETTTFCLWNLWIWIITRISGNAQNCHSNSERWSQMAAFACFDVAVDPTTLAVRYKFTESLVIQVTTKLPPLGRDFGDWHSTTQLQENSNCM